MCSNRTFGVLLSICLTISLILIAGCQGPSLSNGSQVGSAKDEWGEFGRRLIEKCKAEDVDALYEQMSQSDMRELAQIANDMGIVLPTGQALEKAQQQHAKTSKDEIRTFLRSYKDLFDGQLAVVVTLPIDLKGSKFETPSGPKDAESIMKRLAPCRVIVWVRNSNRFFGIYLPEVYKTKSGRRVNIWIKDDSHMGHPGASIESKRAKLESAALEACTFPSDIEYETKYQ